MTRYLFTAAERDQTPARIECWWDRLSQSYVTQLLTAEGDQIGDARYDGTDADAAYSVRHAVSEAGRARINLHLSEKVARAVRQTGWKLEPYGRSPEGRKVYRRMWG